MADLETALAESALLHRPLTLDDSGSFEKRILEKEVITERQEVTGVWQHVGRGEVALEADALHLTSAARYATYPAGYPEDGDYTNFGEVAAELHFAGENWERFTQLKFRVTAACQNISNAAITISFANEGQIKVPDCYDREGYHVVNLKNHSTQDYVLDISNLPRDLITRLKISLGVNGSYMNLPGKWDLQISHLALETNQKATNAKGWQLAEDELSYSHVGYEQTGTKTVIAHGNYQGSPFYLKSSQGVVVFQGELVAGVANLGAYAIADFSEVTQAGEYYLEVGSLQTELFAITSYEKLLKSSAWKALNFIYCERCGCPITGIHGTCHQDVYAEFEGRQVIFNGGWHDAGDLSQQLVQSAELTLGLVEAAAKQSDPVFAQRLLEEAEWGLDFIFKTRLGQGYRVTSAGITRWTDNQIGSMDDAKARIHNSPYDNFLITGILAKIALLLPADHPLQEPLQSILASDYQDAYAGFEKAPFVHEPIFWEHTYSTSKSLYLATLVWTSALMFQVTKDELYRQRLLTFLPELLACQERQGIALFDGRLLKGMFYRDESHKVFQHFNHQAREHLYAWAFAESLAVLADSEWRVELLQAAQDYGTYLSYLMEHTAPYPMIASGIYRHDEWQDTASFAKQHLLTGDEAPGDYQKQLVAGVEVAPGYYVKRFPVWFSFRGNNAILLSMGESAVVLGDLLQDEALREIGFSQLQWILGKNPFAQSLMYGEGNNYPQQYSVNSGEIMGELPVGMQTFANEDEPYWPQFNNATYKEVWVGLAGKWLSLTAKLMNKTEKRRVHD